MFRGVGLGGRWVAGRDATRARRGEKGVVCGTTLCTRRGMGLELGRGWTDEWVGQPRSFLPCASLAGRSWGTWLLVVLVHHLVCAWPSGVARAREGWRPGTRRARRDGRPPVVAPRRRRERIILVLRVEISLQFDGTEKRCDSTHGCDSSLDLLPERQPGFDPSVRERDEPRSSPRDVGETSLDLLAG